MKRYILILLLYSTGLRLQAQCDSTLLPIVFIHGSLASGDTYAGQIKRFIEAGYCENRLFVFDWNTINVFGKKNDSLLRNFIDRVRRITGSQQIDLVGHSAGGRLARGYLIDSATAATVAHYIHLGSSKWYTPLPWFPNNKCLNIFSSADSTMGTRSGVVEGARNLDLKDKDHYEVATCEETFSAIYAYLHAEDKGKGKKKHTVVTSYPFSISGRAVYLGDNKPIAGAIVNCYTLDKRTGSRTGEEAEQHFITDDAGYWGPFKNADMHQRYELELIPPGKGQRTISYFFESFSSADQHVYLRGFPTDNMIAAMTGQVPSRDDQSAIVIYSASHTIKAGRDSVTINSIPVSTPLLTPASNSVVSIFLVDDGDGKGNGEPINRFANFPIGIADIYLPAGTGKSHTIYFNGRTMALPASASSERIMIAVFN